MKEFAKILFRFRGYTPLPLIIIMIVFFNPMKISTIMGFTLIIIGELLRFWGVGYAGEITRTTSRLRADVLITSGPFTYVRNPLYIGNIFIYLGFAIFSNALFPFLQLMVFGWFIFQYTLIIKIEEDFLENKFGVEYLKYKTKVHRFFPKIIPLNSDSIIEPNYAIALRSESRTFQALFSAVLVTLIIYLVKQ